MSYLHAEGFVPQRGVSIGRGGNGRVVSTAQSRKRLWTWSSRFHRLLVWRCSLAVNASAGIRGATRRSTTWRARYDRTPDNGSYVVSEELHPVDDAWRPAKGDYLEKGVMSIGDWLVHTDNVEAFLESEGDQKALETLRVAKGLMRERASTYADRARQLRAETADRPPLLPMSATTRRPR